MLTGVLRAGKHGNSLRLREPLLEQFDALADEFYGEVGHAGKITPRPCPTLYKVCVERIAAEAEHDRLFGLHRPESQDRELLRHDDFGIGCEKLARHRIDIVQSRCPENPN